MQKTGSGRGGGGRPAVLGSNLSRPQAPLVSAKKRGNPVVSSVKESGHIDLPGTLSSELIFLTFIGYYETISFHCDGSCVAAETDLHDEGLTQRSDFLGRE
jgi:hypothetical protein